MTPDPECPEGRQAILRHMLRTEFPVFAKRALHVLVPDMEENWHLETMADFGRDFAEGTLRRGIVNAPPRSLKSIMFSSVMPAFLMGQNPNAQIICMSHSQDLADQLALGTLRILQEPWYQKTFDKTRLARKGVSNLITTAGGYRLATSIGGGVTGRGGDFIIVDDPINSGDADSETMRPKINNWFDKSVHSRLNRQKTGGLLIVMQRVHQDDLSGHMLETGLYTHLNLPAIAQEETTYSVGYGDTHTFKPGEALHPAMVDLPELADLRVLQGSRVFEAQYLQQPVPADGMIFKRDWLRYGDVVRKPGDRFVQSWDAASKGGAQNDYSVCITAIVRRSQVLILDVYRDRLEFPALKKKAIELALQYKPEKLLIEDAAAGTQLIQMLQAEQPRGVPLPIAVKAVNNKIERAIIASARVEAGALILPEKAPWLDTFVNELMSFPSGKHDDQVDALSHLMAHTQSGGTFRPVPSFGGD